MSEWLNEVKPLTFKGQISVPYTWWAGETGGRFLAALRDEKKILGTKCGSCGSVFVPARKYCSRCFIDMDEWVEVGNEGEIETFTIVHYGHPVQPLPPPFAYALIRLTGADVGFLHLIRNDLEKLKVGAKVKAIYREDRDGNILDIDSFGLL